MRHPKTKTFEDKMAQSEEKIMKAYKNLSKAELETLQKELQAKYDTIKASGISLDMSRGKPELPVCLLCPSSVSPDGCCSFCLFR